MSKDNNHWLFEDYKQRMTTQEWKKMLLEGDDTLIYKGRMRQLTSKKLGHGVVEVYKMPLGQEEI